ncbi:zf-HC2 domain-containing protein [Mycobacterium sp. M26]|uniref:anti-sigma factor family protein n=1 Tax=Mycobacterium sp. M26 TaxID=1762962 RepID=UPI0009E92D21|nr:zf-HC2 domain-containing protein [Mycobacterium sp. M26]
MPKPMTCAALVELLSDYYSGALDAPTAARVRLHLLICKGCRGYLAQLRTTVAIVGRLRPDDLDPEFRKQLVGAFHDWQ